MGKYILGIDSTFHVAGIGLINENGRVILNEKIGMDFSGGDAKDFFNFHNKSLLTLIKPVLKKYSKDIFLISASCEDGPFHSMPVGAIIANSLGYFYDKKNIGVNHETAHLFSNRLDRDEKDFLFPIVSLNISGAHSSISLIKNDWESETVSEITWTDDERSFGGLGASSDFLCHILKMHIKKGDGGQHFEKLAREGKPVFKEKLSDLPIQENGNNFNFKETKLYFTRKIEDLGYGLLADNAKIEEFRKNFASSAVEVLFELLVQFLAKIAKKFNAREIHLSGGIATNKILAEKISNYSRKNNLNFKSPAKDPYCLDNGAMVAMAGYYKWEKMDPCKYSEFLEISPSEWYYKYYMYLKFRNLKGQEK